MRLADFELERYFARWEFSAPFLLCASDAEPYRLDELLALADPQTGALWQELGLGYTESPGHPLLRAEIASLYEGLTEEQVLVCSGAEEAIFLLVHAALEPGDHAIVTTPAYQSLTEVARSAGANVTSVELEHDAGWGLDVEALRKAVTPKTRLIVLNFPHNPTGALPDRATFTAAVGVAREARAVLLSDEVYTGLELDENDRLPPATELYERAASIGVMSKAYGLAGLRIGWVASRDADLLGRVAALKDYTTICNSAPSEILSLIALRARDVLLARNRAIVRENLSLVDRFLADQAHSFEWVRPRAGTTGFPKLLADVPVERFCQELVESEGVLLLPGTIYAHGGNHFRIGFGRRTMPQALERLERHVSRTLDRSAER